MAEKINLLIEDENMRKNFSNKAMEGTEKFNIDKIATQWKDLIEKL